MKKTKKNKICKTKKRPEPEGSWPLNMNVVISSSTIVLVQYIFFTTANSFMSSEQSVTTTLALI